MVWTMLRVTGLASLTTLIAVLALRVQIAPRDRAVASTVSQPLLPQQVSLSGWQFQKSQTLAVPQAEATQWLAGRRYQYRYQGRPLTLEMRYFKDTGIADVRVWLHHSRTGSIDLTIRRQPTVGYYGLASDRQHVSLTACIPPQGQGTVTANQFQQNLYGQNARLDHLWSWLMGHTATPLFDDRCLWAYLFMPQTDQTPEDTYIVLEQAWGSWFRWWSQNYPQPSALVTESDKRP